MFIFYIMSYIYILAIFLDSMACGYTERSFKNKPTLRNIHYKKKKKKEKVTTSLGLFKVRLLAGGFLCEVSMLSIEESLCVYACF